MGLTEDIKRKNYYRMLFYPKSELQRFIVTACHQAPRSTGWLAREYFGAKYSKADITQVRSTVNRLRDRSLVKLADHLWVGTDRARDWVEKRRTLATREELADWLARAKAPVEIVLAFTALDDELGGEE